MRVREVAQHLQPAKGAVAGPTLAAVLRQVARAQPPVTHRSLSEALDLSAATVSKAITEMREVALLTPGEALSLGPGRPLIPLHWSDTHALIGVYVGDTGGLPTELTAVATTAGGELLCSPLRTTLRGKAQANSTSLITEIDSLVTDLRSHCDVIKREPLGIGVAVGGHVRRGVIRLSYNTGWGAGDKRGNHKWAKHSGFEIARLLEQVTGSHVVADNDVTALAVFDNLYQQHTADTFAVIAVFHHGIGGGLVINGRPWRGHDGVAGEIGHVIVNDGDPDARCRYGHSGCVEALAAPAAILRQLSSTDFTELTKRPFTDNAAKRVFYDAGSALGRGIAPMLNWLNPGLVHLYLPEEFELTASSELVGACYLEGLSDVVASRGFSTSRDVVFERHHLSASELELRGARAAASLVLEALIEQLEGGDAQRIS